MSTDWRGVDDNGPRITPRVVRWFRWRVRDILALASQRPGFFVGPERSDVIAALVDWYADRVDEFVGWHAHAEYQGVRYSLGHWKVEGLSARIAEAYNAVCGGFGLPPRREAASPPSTPKPPREQPIPPGPIDVEAALQALAIRPKWAPSEDYSWALLRKRDGELAAKRHLERRRRFERSMPRICKTCGETFTSACQAVTCKTCKAARRKRCCQCGEVFTAESAKEKRCEPCIEKAAKAGDVASASLLERKRSGTDSKRGRRA